MQINLNPKEEQIIKDALNAYTDSTLVLGDKYNTTVNILNKINQSGLVQLQRTPNVLLYKEYIFYFNEGGWNTVWAKTIRGAAKIVSEKEWDLESGPTPDINSLHLATKEELTSVDSLFYETIK